VRRLNIGNAGARAPSNWKRTFEIDATAMRSIYKILADLLDYPVADWQSRCDECKELLIAESESFVSQFALFASETEKLSLSDLQELYTRTFDLSPVCALDIGYHLFGENYKRGVFLANLRETEAPFDLGQEHQLPDYLPVLLRLLTKLTDEELRSALIVDCMIPALEKMLKTLGEGENPYRHLIAAVNAKLKSEAGAYPATIQRAHLPILQAVAFAETNTDLF
jgi:nitrate reductase molybdenum cofactor assembly chaperone